MLIRGKKPHFDAVDGEFVVPIRFSEEATYNLLGGWFPIGIGAGHLKPRPDGSYDLFLRTPTSEELNVVKLDMVSAALMAALDLATYIEQDDTVSDEVTEAAQRIKELVSYSSS